jgi:hypothetical protein
MKIILHFAFFLSFFVVSCKNAPKTEATETSTPATKTPVSTIRCFSKIEGNDTTAAEITVNGEEVTGFYAWEPYEKDGAWGMIKGKIAGDIITADFTFMIEGNTQSEEVMFKLAGDNMTQAQGALDDKNGKMVFKDKAAVTWKDVFTKADCGVIKGSIQRAKDISAMITGEKK